MTHLIHFADLDEMAPELKTGEPVRVALLNDVQQVNEVTGAVTNVIVVYVRQIQEGKILSWAFPIAVYETANGKPISDEAEQERENGMALAEQIESAIHTHLSRLYNLNPRPGIVDLNGRSPMLGTWDKWEKEHYKDQES